MAMAKLKAKRIGTGYYEVSTPHGVYGVENIPAPKGSGYGSGPNWIILAPGQDVGDVSKPTKREAMEYIQAICDEQTEAPDATQGSGFLVDPHTWLRGRLNK